MQTQIAQLVEEFNKNVRPRVSAEYWAKASQAFDIFWKKQIMTGNLAKGQGREIDDLHPIIRLLDPNAKKHYRDFKDEKERQDLKRRIIESGKQYGLDYEIEESENELLITKTESVAKAMVTQGQWHIVFFELASFPELREKLDQIFKETIPDKKAQLIDELKSLNEKHKNYLTKPAATALCAIMSLQNPANYVQVVSLNHRKIIIECFGLGVIDVKESYGKQIIHTNELLLSFDKKFDVDFSPVELTYFLYTEEVREIWEPEHIQPESATVTAPRETQEGAYFILITGSKEYDDSKERYHFRKGIPGCNQLLEAENRGRFVYYQDGKFYAKGEIGDISSEEKEGTTFYYAKVKNYEEIGPVKFEEIRANLSFGSVGAAGIRRIRKEDYDTIVGKTLPQGTDFIERDLELPSDFTLDPLLFEDKEDLELRIMAALKAGNNIMLVGPPGTGKTEVALSLGKQFSEKGPVNTYIMTTATSDWTTFDTIGGYVPSSDGNGLVFQPGLFLRCFKNVDKPINRWLIIDEINRADIDKAFGQLFTLLSGQSVELPFQKNSKNIGILSHKDCKEREIAPNQYVMPKSWRLIATLNTYDKASLYQMSYAFMRRFAFIHVAAPNCNFIEEKWSEYLACWGLRVPAELTGCVDNVRELWESMNEDSKRPLGPAIIKDMLHYILNQAEKHGTLDDGIRKKIVTNAVISFILPQFEGLEKSDLDNLKKRISQYCLSDKIDSLCYEMFEG